MTTSNNAQSSMEYLLVVSLALLFIIPTFYFFYGTTQRSTDLAISEQVERIGSEMVATAERTYALGRHTKLTVDLTMPPNVEDVRVINENELVFTVTSSGRSNKLVFFSNVDMVTAEGCVGATATDSMGSRFTNPGKKQVRMISCGQNVTIWS